MLYRWIDADFFSTVFHIEIRQIALSLAEFSWFGKQSRDSDANETNERRKKQQHTTTYPLNIYFKKGKDEL